MAAIAAKHDPAIHRLSPPNENDYDQHHHNDNLDAKGPNSAANMNLTIPARPGARPFKRANLSLEQNPFEVSFSQSASSVPSTSPNNSNKALPHPASNNSSRPDSDDPQSRDPPSGSDANGSAPKTSPKPVLPPLSAIAEGTRETPNGFPWGFSSGLNDAGSLRSGPLSPAMLPGPRPGAPPVAATASVSHQAGSSTSHGYFDAPSLSFRTGLTPGIGRTGLTPLVGGPASFPPPSPNTAAFLAMVTNGVSGGAVAQAVNQLTAGATITPNTLSALTGSLMHANAAAAAEGNSSGGQNGQQQQGHHQQGHPIAQSGHHPHPLSVSHAPSYQQGQYAANGAGGDGNYGQQPPAGPYAGAAQTAANAAANGLFLLSQAHQELTKREEQQAAEAAAAATASTTAAPTVSTRGTASRKASAAVAPATQNHNKRKSGDAQMATGGRAPGGKRARGSTSTTVVGPSSMSPIQPTRSSSRRRKSDMSMFGPGPEMTSPIDDDDSMDEDDMAEGAAEMAERDARGGGSKKFETEEEKRKNFLERNRQAALKCRQRKKAWLTQLQQQVEYLKTENDRLQGTIVSMRDEVTRLSAVVVAHRACGLGGVVVPGYVSSAPAAAASGERGDHASSPSDVGGNGGGASPSMSPVVSVAPVSVPVNVPPPQSGQSSGGQQSSGAGGYGY